MSPSRVRVLTTIVGVLAGWLLAGCGGDDGSDDKTGGDRTTAVRDAVDATLELNSFTIDLDVAFNANASSFGFTAKGYADYAKIVADVTMNVDNGADSSEVRIKADGTHAWVGGDGDQFASFPAGAEWVEGDAKRLASADSFTQTGLLGAVLILRAADDVKDEGTDDLDGVEVHRYSTTVVYDDALEAAGDQADALKSSFSLTGSASSSKLHVDVALDDDGVVRALDIEIDSDVPIEGAYRLRLDDPNGDMSAPQSPDPGVVVTGPQADELFGQLLS